VTGVDLWVIVLKSSFSRIRQYVLHPEHQVSHAVQSVLHAQKNYTIKIIILHSIKILASLYSTALCETVFAGRCVSCVIVITICCSCCRYGEVLSRIIPQPAVRSTIHLCHECSRCSHAPLRPAEGRRGEEKMGRSEWEKWWRQVESRSLSDMDRNQRQSNCCPALDYSTASCNALYQQPFPVLSL